MNMILLLFPLVLIHAAQSVLQVFPQDFVLNELPVMISSFQPGGVFAVDTDWFLEPRKARCLRHHLYAKVILK